MQAYHCRSVRASIWHRPRNEVDGEDAEESCGEAERGTKEEVIYDWVCSSLSSRLLWLLLIEGEVFIQLVEQLLEVVAVAIGVTELV